MDSHVTLECACFSDFFLLFLLLEINIFCGRRRSRWIIRQILFLSDGHKRDNWIGGRFFNYSDDFICAHWPLLVLMRTLAPEFPLFFDTNVK